MNQDEWKEREVSVGLVDDVARFERTAVKGANFVLAILQRASLFGTAPHLKSANVTRCLQQPREDNIAEFRTLRRVSTSTCYAKNANRHVGD